MKRFIRIYIRHMCLVLILMTQVKLLAQTPTQATIVTATPSDAAILAALNGGGLTLSNGVLVQGIRNKQIAVFNGGTQAGFGMNNGVLFSTGNASEDIASRNLNATKGYDNQTTYSDPDLVGISSFATNDVVVYTFDVKLDSYTTALRIAFQFGSEEYPDWVGTIYNDAFGFFVTGPGISGTSNMARIPANQKPISINTINAGKVGVNGTQTYVGLDLTQSGTYINNGHTTQVDPLTGRLVDNSNLNNGPKPVYIEYNGLTKLITYDLTGLQAGGTYKFKIAIADASDHIYDSGVIIQKVQGTTGADVTIKKEVDNMNPNIDDVVEFTLTANNLGPYDGNNVEVADQLPNGYTFVSATPSKGTYDSTTGKWTIGTLQAIHETVTLKIKAKVNKTGTYTNVATIKSTDPDPDSTNNTSTVTPVPKIVDLSILKTVSKNNPDVGEQVVFTLNVNNIGPANASEVIVNDQLPNGYMYVSDDGNGAYNANTGIWTIGSLAVGVNNYLKITAKVLETGVYRNVATVQGKEFDPNLGNNKSEVTPIPVVKPSFRLYKTGIFNDLNSNGYASNNETITYTFRLKNTGNVTISSIQLSDPLFGGTISGPISGDLDGNGKLGTNEEWVFTKTYNINSVDIRRKGVYNLATATGKDTNNGVITATSTDPNPLPVTTPGHPGIDPNCPDCTIVILKGLNLIITNPMLPSKSNAKY